MLRKELRLPPTRSRHDDQIVEVFLQVHEGGRFSRNPNWLPQHVRNVEVIATASDGTRLALEHTRVFAFDGHAEQEELLRPIAEALESVDLPGTPQRWFQVRFHPNFMGRGLKKHGAIVKDQLMKFVESTFPLIEPRDHYSQRFDVPIQLPNGRCPTIAMDVEVWQGVDTERSIKVSGCLPSGQRLANQVRLALEDNLPKLMDTDAHVRLLIVDLVSHTESEIETAKHIDEIGSDFPLLARVNGIVFAHTFGFKIEGCIFFRQWDPNTRTWSETLEAIIDRERSAR